MEVVGVTRVRNCCSVVWMEEQAQRRRLVLARPYHCAACVGEMVRSAKLQRILVVGSVPMERLRDALSQRRSELIDRWRRQLRAAAEGGFALDPGTGELLPRLLDATDRALERRSRAVDPGLPAAGVLAQRAALQCSLLRDFLLDTALEAIPGLTAAEQRLWSDALAHAAVEVEVRDALEREQDQRRREARRLARLAHDLRNSATAARLAVDLLRRRGALPDSRTSRLLEASLAAIRNGIEDTLLDEALCAGGLRVCEVRLAPMLREAQREASDLAAAEKNVSVVLARAGAGLRVNADPRLARGALRGLLRAAVQIARPGATIEVDADAARERARIAVLVNGCARSAARLPDLPALSLARRAARVHGGTLSARLSGGAARLRLALPCARRR